MTVSVDPSSAALLAPGFLRLVEGADLLLPNLAEASALTGVADPERAAKRLVERVPEVVVTLGSEGALWRSGAEVVRAAAAPASAVIDTTGAGDAFTAGFLAARLEDAGPTAALAAGCRLAGEAVGIQGARPKATA
jgi:ribokinase